MLDGELNQAELTLKSLKDVKASRAWQCIKDEIKDDSLDACLQMADNPNMSNKEIDYRRGAIGAARNFANVLDLMINRLENDILLASAERQTHFNLNATAFKDSL